jgi:hypothetical protein
MMGQKNNGKLYIQSRLLFHFHVPGLKPPPLGGQLLA